MSVNSIELRTNENHLNLLEKRPQDNEDLLIVQIPNNRKPIGHLPEVFKNITVLKMEDGKELRAFVHSEKNVIFGSIKVVPEKYSVVEWKYDQNTSTCKMLSAFLLHLPHWVKIEDRSFWMNSEKGIPLMQACKAMLFNAMELKNRDVKKISLFSVNPITALEVNAALLQGDSFETACLKSQSAYLAAELGSMLGEKKVRLSQALKVKMASVQRDSFTEHRLKTDPEKKRPFQLSIMHEQGTNALLQKAEEFSKRIGDGETYEFVKSIQMEFDVII